MGRSDFLRLGDFNAVCYQCGFKRKASEMEKNWQGYYVCPEHNEPRQTQDFVRAIPDDQTTPWAQPDPPTIYTYTNVALPQVPSGIIISDGLHKQYQFGSGLGAGAVTYQVTAVFVNGQARFIEGIDANGVITFLDVTTVPIGSIVTASGTETVLA